MINFRSPKGFFTYWNDDAQKRSAIINQLNFLAQQQQFLYVELPLAETTSVFQKALGPSSDVVMHQFFYLKSHPQLTNFSSRATTDLVLRPELTSGLIRALIEQKIFSQQFSLSPEIFYTHGFCFRHENPQKGRSRQFLQWNIEQLPFSPTFSASQLAAPALLRFLNQILEAFALKPHVVLEINFLTASQLERAQSKLKLLSLPNLCKICHNRQKTGNIFRILDCKNCSAIVANKINLHTLLDVAEKKQFENLQKLLKVNLPALSIVINEKLTRGLDYYTGLVFELKAQSSSESWAQNTLLAGGEYALSRFPVTQLNSSNSDFAQSYGFGFAIGIERLLLFLEKTDFEFRQLDSSFPLKIVLGLGKSHALQNLHQLQDGLHMRGYGTKVFYQIFSSFSKILVKSRKEKADWLVFFHNADEAEVVQITINKSPGKKITLPHEEVLTFFQKMEGK